MSRNFQIGRLALFAATLATMCWGFSGMFLRAAQVFSYDREDMSFGWYVPLFSLYVLWTGREQLKRALGAPSIWGLVASIPFLALALLGTRGLQLRFEQLGFIGLCVTVPWAFFGRRVAKHCLFPAAYLLFTIPVSSFLDFFTVHLRLLASGAALGVLKGFGFEVVQKGTAIICEQGAHPFSIDVAEPCSGLRSFFALTALTAAYAYYNQPTWTRRALLFLCAGPLAVLGNVMRVLTICLVAAYADPDFALGFYHDYSGYVVFIVAISAMVAVGEGISRLAASKAFGRLARSRKAVEVPADKTEVAGGSLSWRVWLVPGLATLALSGLFIFQAQTPMGMVMSAPEVELPEVVGGMRGEEVRYCQNEQCGRFFVLSQVTPPGATCPTCGGELDGVSLGEHRILPPDTQFRRRMYRSTSGAEFLVSAVIGGETKNSIHRPELCLPAQGYLLAHPHDFMVGGVPFHAVEMTPPGGVPGTLAYTFFNQDGVRTASHLARILRDVWDRSFHNRVDRWVMVTVYAGSPHGFSRRSLAGRVELDAFLLKLSESLK